ncbi:OLC1v1016796C1 [Oldenlandia corymbosa var. corymbosa]|uniref:OLC1v1016796C1 n=1 Tax=Oldenlandia corymbosa var. corymbosa TaxID=529605 RepID=A0AAV1E7Z8_OLDCO|nr:OLC1v1016796C1 [Oldenlandia corymbosa var. corymbosa]
MDQVRGSTNPEVQATAWMWMMMSTTLFVDKSGGGRIHAQLLHELFDDLDGVSSRFWASVTLAYLYRQLGVTSIGGVKQMGGCLTLLLAWIYGYFSIFRPHNPHQVGNGSRAAQSKPAAYTAVEGEVRLKKLRKDLDSLSPDDVVWEPFGKEMYKMVPKTIFTGWLAFRNFVEPYMPDRMLRQLGYVQIIPMPTVVPQLALRAMSGNNYKVEFSEVYAGNAWLRFPQSGCLILSSYTRSTKAACADDYLYWFYHYFPS